LTGTGAPTVGANLFNIGTGIHEFVVSGTGHTLIGFLGQHAETRSTPNGTVYTRFSLATSVSWKEKGSDEYKTRTEWRRVISWNKLGAWAGALQKGAYVEVEGELPYREFTPAESDRSVRVAEIYATSILALEPGD
jgi:single-strand DNA-binding protein